MTERKHKALMARFDKLKDQKFGRLVVLPYYKRPPGHRPIRWACRCECGNVSYVRTSHLSKASGCGACTRSENIKKAQGASFRHGLIDTKTYRIWTGMHSRCLRETDPAFPKYGGRGIGIDPRWLHNFEAFLADMGECPDGLTLDRVDNSKGYSPSNCRWATWLQQNNNKSSNRLISFDGKTMSVSEWARVVGVKPTTLFYRLNAGWSVERALGGGGADSDLKRWHQPCRWRWFQDCYLPTPETK